MMDGEAREPDWPTRERKFILEGEEFQKNGRENT